MEEALALGACDYVMPDAERIGGVTGWRVAASLAQARGIPMSTHLFPEISSHLLCITPTAHWLEFVDWASPVLAEPPRVVDGHVTPPERPGIGIEWNREAVERYRIS
jgi:mandelate racemase